VADEDIRRAQTGLCQQRVQIFGGIAAAGGARGRIAEPEACAIVMAGRRATGDGRLHEQPVPGRLTLARLEHDHERAGAVSMEIELAAAPIWSAAKRDRDRIAVAVILRMVLLG